MRIVHVITKCDYGGAQTVVRELALEQRRRGHEVSVITGLLGPVAGELRTAGIDVVLDPSLVHALAPAGDFRAVRSIRERLRMLSPDVVHTHSSKGGLVGRVAARTLDTAVVYTAHGWPFQRGAATTQRLVSFGGEWAAGRTNAHVVCVSNAELRLARRLRIVPESRLHLVHNGVGHEAEAEPVRPVGSPCLELVMVARLSSPKRPDVLLEAVSRRSDVAVTFVGDGLLRRELEHRAVPLGDRVRFVGVTEPAPYLGAAHVAVLLSDYEGLPLSVIEAMRQRLPVLTNHLPGVVDAIEHQHNGIVCALSVPDVVAALETLQDDELRVRLGAAARKTWRERFTAEAMTDGYDTVYRIARSA